MTSRRLDILPIVTLVVSFVGEEASQNQRPLPDPLPAPPAIPYEYLQRLAGQIESTELNQAQQFAVVDQLRRAITEETDDGVRPDILDMLHNLMSKPWSTRRTESEVRFILFANGIPEQSLGEPPQTAQPERKSDSEPPQVSTPEPKDRPGATTARDRQEAAADQHGTPGVRPGAAGRTDPTRHTRA